MKKYDDYYLGLDIGTDSVGYAVTNSDYKLLKYKGEPMWGTHLFDATKQASERRGFRSARRRLDRRNQRVQFLQDIFAEEIAKVDPKFYIRLKESFLFPEDKSTDTSNVLFDDENYKDKDYYTDYPTIHHLICDLMKENPKHEDVRLVYIACSWLVKHRGHFLNEVSKDNIESIVNISDVYQRFIDYLSNNEFEMPWECSEEDFAKVLSKKVSITKKEKEFYGLLFNGKNPKNEVTEQFPFGKSATIKLISGGKVTLSDLFDNKEYKELKLQLSSDDLVIQETISSLNENESEYVLCLKALYDWSVLSDLLSSEKFISYSKVKIYEEHKQDLKNLKYLMKKYLPNDYKDMFCNINKSNNYVAYSGNFKSIKDKDKTKKTNKLEFYKLVKTYLGKIKAEEQDLPIVESIISRIEIESFMPKQVDANNGVIPYQLYWIELKKILDSAKNYLPFLLEKDEISNYDKILEIFTYKIPYFIGPLGNHGEYKWLIKNSNNKIYPWNFETIVDVDSSEKEFIRRMTNKCTYLLNCDVIPKNSLLYSKFNVLNEINNIKINSIKITPELKQSIYNDLFLKYKKVTFKKLKEYLIANGYCDSNDQISGIDQEIKSSLKSYHIFRRLLENKALSEEDVEKIIERHAYSEDSIRMKKWLSKEFSHLSQDDINYIVKQSLKEFGRLSKEFLNEFICMNETTGEIDSIIGFMWNYNFNLMQLLSDEFTFAKEIEKNKKEFYGSNKSISERIDNMYVSPAVKRPIIRTLDIVNDIVKVTKKEPTKIFIEMARFEGVKERKDSRKEKLLKLYKEIDDVSVKQFEQELMSLGEKSENLLQSESVYHYFTQLGKCMYSGQSINFDKIKELYDNDHIYPQSAVKDDSLLNNKVLVLKEINQNVKKDIYPLPKDIRDKMTPYWKKLLKYGLITEEKYMRLTRSTPFTDDEKWQFISRQLVETRQSTKAIATLLKELYPNSEIVYVKAGLVSDFRNEYDLVKCRSINDLHHAKDAYLNIVVGNVYHSKFTKQWFMNNTNKYSIKTTTLFGREQIVNNEKIWNGSQSIGYIKKVMNNNHIHLTKYAYKEKGGFFDQNPVKAKEGLIPLKKGLDTSKYGGYNKAKASYFILVKCIIKNKTEIYIMPINVIDIDKFESNKQYAYEYVENKLINDYKIKSLSNIELLFDSRILKINTMFEIDGFRIILTGKGDNRNLFRYYTSCIFDDSMEKYIKKVESFSNKITKNPNFIADSKFDGITTNKNIELYEQIIEKHNGEVFRNAPCSRLDTLEKGKSTFINLSVKDQVQVLMNALSLLKTNRANAVDLSLIEGAKNEGKVRLNDKLSNWKKNYKEVYIVDTSSSGLYEKKSINLMDLL